MALGCVMKIDTGELQLELAPFSKEEAEQFALGFQSFTVNRYLKAHSAQTVETEHEWYERMIHDRSNLVWGIWIIEDGKRHLIGNSALTHITYGHVSWAVSGSAITDQQYWGRGIASACHKARTWYAFTCLGLTCIKSDVMQPNVGSRKALERSGYTFVYTKRNVAFDAGKLIHQDNLECINPSPAAWRLWWGSDKPTKRALAARRRSLESLEWAEAHVTMS